MNGQLSRRGGRGAERSTGADEEDREEGSARTTARSNGAQPTGATSTTDEATASSSAADTPSSSTTHSRSDSPASLSSRRNKRPPKLENFPEDGLPDQIVLKRTPSRPSGPGGLTGRVFSATGKARGRPSFKISAPGTPFHELDLSEIPWLVHDGEDHGPKGLTRYRRLFFLAGIIAGALIAWLYADKVVVQQRLNGLRSMVDEQIGHFGANFPGMDWANIGIPHDLATLGNDLFSAPRKWLEQRDFTVGLQLREKENLHKKHPVVLMPGIISTGLEAWSTDPGAFRKRLWGGTSMLRAIATQKEMWIKHLSLDPVTGLDPPGIKVRAAQGLDAASYFVSGYWIWARIIENLAAIGYDLNDLHLASYDWRLSYHNLETRDHFYSRTKLHIEHNLHLTGKKSVIVAHSMGSSVALHFLKWCEASGPGYGNGGDDWTERHVESLVSIAGTFLGVPKAMAALLSGEMRDTAELPPPAAYLLEKFFSRNERAQLFRTWAGSASMLIKGGAAVWGNLTWAPDDTGNSSSDGTHGKFYSFKLPEVPLHQGAGDAASGEGASASQHDLSSQHRLPTNLSVEDGYTWLLQHTPSTFQQMVESNYSNGIEYDAEQVRRNNQIEKTWANPLEAALPNAPSMKLHCIYGVGKPTERSYWYVEGPYESEDAITEGDHAACLDCGNFTSATPLRFPTGRSSWIDTSVHREKGIPMVRSGVKFSDGDGTVSVQSLGAMCHEGWKRKRYNPGNIKVYTHEILHEPDPLDLRGGLKTGDHVDILGSGRVNEIVLRVAAGRGAEVNETVFSEAPLFAKRINWDGPAQ